MHVLRWLRLWYSSIYSADGNATFLPTSATTKKNKLDWNAVHGMFFTSMQKNILCTEEQVVSQE